MRIFVSGLINVETTVKVRGFPIGYYPIDYPFFGVNTAVSGVAYNIARALTVLGDTASLHTMVGDDFQAAYIHSQLEKCGISRDGIRGKLRQTPSSVILYEESGRRQVYCDLKDIQETDYGFSPACCTNADLVVACNINFNRPLLKLAMSAGKKIATDVHVLSNPYDDYNRDFLSAADILFLSDEGVGDDYLPMIRELAKVYNNEIIVMGRGSKGAALYIRGHNGVLELPAVQVGPVVNTVGAGDALFSGFIHFYAKGLEPADALIRAELFASAKIGTSGGAEGFLSEEALEGLYREFGGVIRDGGVHRAW